MASTLKVNIVGDAKKFTEATKKAEHGLDKMGKATNKIAGMMKGALGAIAGAISIGAVVSVLKDAAGAAMEDAKSQALLANQMKNTMHATDKMTASAEDAISKMSLMAAVPDDEIRPAFASFIRSTKSVKKATDLTSLALDVAAGTGKDLGTVTKALTAAYGGNTKSLGKLGINVKKGANWFKEAKRQFNGMAEAAARQDPAKRISDAFSEMQESLGKGLLPMLNEFADWLIVMTPKVQQFFTDAWNSDTVQGLKDTLKGLWTNVLSPMLDWLGSKDVQTAIGELFKSLGGVLKSIGDFAASDLGKKLGKLVDPILLGSLKTLSELLDAIAGALDRISGKPIPLTQANAKATTMINPYSSYLGSQKLTSGQVLDRTYGNMSSVGGPKTVVVNNYITNPNPKAILDNINKYLKSNGQGRIQTTGY